jgi:hypothetical protein
VCVRSLRTEGKIRGQRRMPLLSNGHLIRLIDDRYTTGLRPYQHADENCERADEADGPHGFTPKKVATGSRKGDLLGCKRGKYSFTVLIVLSRSRLRE